MQRQQSSAQDCPSSRKNAASTASPCLCLGVQVREGFDELGAVWRRRLGRDFCLLPVSRLLSSAGGLLQLGEDVWKAQAEEEHLGRKGMRETAPCIQSSGEQAGCATPLWLKANLKATGLRKSQKFLFAFILLPSYYFLLHITAVVLRGFSWNQVPLVPGCSALRLQTPSARVCSLTGPDRPN